MPQLRRSQNITDLIAKEDADTDALPAGPAGSGRRRGSGGGARVGLGRLADGVRGSGAAGRGTCRADEELTAQMHAAAEEPSSNWLPGCATRSPNSNVSCVGWPTRDR